MSHLLHLGSNTSSRKTSIMRTQMLPQTPTISSNSSSITINQTRHTTRIPINNSSTTRIQTWPRHSISPRLTPKVKWQLSSPMSSNQARLQQLLARIPTNQFTSQATMERLSCTLASLSFKRVASLSSTLIPSSAATLSVRLSATEDFRTSMISEPCFSIGSLACTFLQCPKRRQLEAKKTPLFGSADISSTSLWKNAALSSTWPCLKSFKFSWDRRVISKS